MKKIFIRLGIFLTFLVLLIGGNIYLLKNGWWEKTLSTTTIPFQIFRTDKSEKIKEEKIKNDGNRSIENLKSELAPLLSVFTQDLTRPNLSSSGLDSESINLLNSEFDKIYGVEYQGISKAVLSGLIQDKDGWNPIITFSIVNDSSQVRNLSYKLQKGKTTWRVAELIADTQENFSYSETDNNFQVSLIDQIVQQDEKFFKNKSWTTSGLEPQVLNLLNTNSTQVISRVLYISSRAQVEITHLFAVGDGTQKLIRTQNLDAVNSSVFDLKLEK